MEELELLNLMKSLDNNEKEKVNYIVKEINKLNK